MATSGETDAELERERDGRLLRLVLEAGENITAARVDRDLRHTWIHNPNPEPVESEVIGRRDDELFPAEVAEPALRVKRAALESGERVCDEFTFHKPWGDRRYEVAVDPIVEDDEVVGASFVAFDVTEEHRLQEQTKALRRQNERLDEFASIVSHDLRNPLNVAQAWIEHARNEGDPDRLEVAERALRRMESLVDDLLELARQGKHISDPDRVSLAAVARRAWETTDTGDATLEVETDADVLADGERLLQLFENLFRNSVDHGGDGVRVRVGLLEHDDGFYVEDDGVGIPDSERERVFEYGVSTSGDGTGFGLAIVENLVHAHGWDVAVVESVEGGVRFEVTNVERLD
jgi:signal transduction histidine kinase